MTDTNLIVFTYAPAGLGHIRVADALISGIPKGSRYTIFAPEDKSTESMHRFSSLNVPARHVMEFFQRGFAEALYTKFYIAFLKKHSNKLEDQFVEHILLQKIKPTTLTIVATHFGLAYQLGSVKTHLEKRLNAKIKLVVQVTDDSPQILWYVDLADLIICPSHQTKLALQKYAQSRHLKQVPIEVVPYPVDLDFSKALAPNQISQRESQLNPNDNSAINIAIPISGAAVGMEFFLHLIQWLHNFSPRFVFYVICRKAPFTEVFLKQIANREYIKVFTSDDYNEVVKMHKQVYLEHTISAEVTKPSEQAFKALINATAIGGSFLLFAHPVGRQEYDNMDFLRRHNFLDDTKNHRRGYPLVLGSKASSDLIWDLFSSGKFLKAFKNFSSPPQTDEVGDNGVTKFWEIVNSLN